MDAYEEEILASGLDTMWRRAEQQEDRIRYIFHNGPETEKDCDLLKLLCAVTLGQICYRRKRFGHEASS